MTIMRERRLRLRGVTRLHQPSQAEPLIVILIDELAALALFPVRVALRSPNPSKCIW